MLTIQNLSYTHSNKDLLFHNISLTVNPNDKIALIGNNGVGKSTLLKIIDGDLSASNGIIKVETKPYFIPQVFGQYNHVSIAEALKVSQKLKALQAILSGEVSEKNYDLLNDDWTIEDRCKEALGYWQLDGFSLSQKLETLSGGEKTKVFLAGISIHQPDLVLLDEPSNHLDNSGRLLLYDVIQNTNSTVIVVSHDRKLLNLLNTVCELSYDEVTTYGGNYDFYKKQKELEINAVAQGIQSKEKALKKAKDKKRETIERQQRLDSRGKKKQEKSGVSRIMMNTLKNNAENSTSKLKNVHAEKIGGITEDLQELRSSLSKFDKMKIGFDNTELHKGKILFTANNINFSYENEVGIWKDNLSFQIVSGERIAIKGRNGSGKTTLIDVILGKRKPQTGTIFVAEKRAVYIDQDYSLIDDKLQVYEQAQQCNTSGLQEHEIRIRLNRFLFPKDFLEKPCSVLSGGERMRLSLCCLAINSQSPDMIILDEPTNNLDLQNIEILTKAITEFKGTLLVISHDETFLNQVNINRTIQLLK